MKRFTTTLLLAGISLGTPAFVLAQGMASPMPPTSESTLQDSRTDEKRSYDPTHQSIRKNPSATASMGTAGIRRVSKDEVENQPTAKHVIGQAVYSSDGKKLGDISDLTISSDFQAAQMAGIARRAGSDSTATTTTASDVARSDATSRRKDASKDWSSAKNMTVGSETQAIISVGGVLGVGDDLVSVPVSALNYDSSEERFTLSVTKDEFLAIAEKPSVSSNSDRTP